ncbi:MAG: tripartite tricarboxylate transporter TctB family protein [Alkalilacustris sp.]
MLKALLKAESLIALGLMGLSVYFMWHAIERPIGWDGARGPGGGAFPFWLSAIMLGAATGILIRAVQAELRVPDLKSFFEPGMIGPVAAVVLALTITIALMSWLGTYVAIPLFMLWYLRFFGRNSWLVTIPLVVATPVVLFFFFEVALLILLPKGITEPLFFPLYAMFF